MTVYVVRAISSGERLALAGDVLRALELLRDFARGQMVELVDGRGILLAVASPSRRTVGAAMRAARRRMRGIAEEGE